MGERKSLCCRHFCCGHCCIYWRILWLDFYVQAQILVLSLLLLWTLLYLLKDLVIWLSVQTQILVRSCFVCVDVVVSVVFSKIRFFARQQIIALSAMWLGKCSCCVRFLMISFFLRDRSGATRSVSTISGRVDVVAVELTVWLQVLRVNGPRSS